MGTTNKVTDRLFSMSLVIAVMVMAYCVVSENTPSSIECKGNSNYEYCK